VESNPTNQELTARDRDGVVSGQRTAGWPMKAIRTSLIVGSAFVAMTCAEPASLVAQTAPTIPPTASLDGTWEGEMNDLPAIELKVDNSSGKVSGTMLFYFQERSDPSQPWHVTRGSPAPLLLPHVEGNILTFELQHHKCHNCVELGPNQKFRVELKDQNEARLWMWENNNAPKDPGPGLKLERRVEPVDSAPPPKATKTPPGSPK
jgi:hypothetical protein